MARIKSFRDVPPGGWRYTQPETAVHFFAYSYDELLTKVKEHREYKGFPVDTLAQDIERQLCLQLDTDRCKAEPGEDYRPVDDLTQRLTTAMVVSLNKALVAFVAGGAKFVELAEANERAAACRGCPFNKPASACSCHAAYRLIEAAIPKERRQPGISVCMACGCSLQAKVNLPLDVVAAALDPNIHLPEWCWQKKAQALRRNQETGTNGTP
jgi:hypothetical protein